MKIAVSSAAFAAAFSAGRTTQLEWLDACANELEVDGVVLATRDFPRTDHEYLAQIKKSATDLGLTIAALATHGLPQADDFTIARALGTPIVVATAPTARDDAAGWSTFVENAKTCVRAAKAAGVVVALGNVAGTLCASAADLKRISYDVDGSWLRYALDPLAASEPGDASALLSKTVIARADIGTASAFACPGDARARTLVDALARFRGFVLLENDGRDVANAEYHAAIARFIAMRAASLQMNR